MTSYTIDEMRIPRSLADDPDGSFAGLMAVRNPVEIAGYGIPEVTVTPEEMLPNYLDEHTPKRVLLTRVDGAIVGRVVHERRRDETEVTWMDVQVLPAFQGRGIGRALSDAIEAIAREFGHARVITSAVSADAPGERLTAPTGFGGVPVGNREVRFLLARGWTLEQVERGGRCALPADPAALDALRAKAGVTRANTAERRARRAARRMDRRALCDQGGAVSRRPDTALQRCGGIARAERPTGRIHSSASSARRCSPGMPKRTGRC